MSDIEKELKDRLREISGDTPAATADEVRMLLERVADYRKRIQTQRRKWDAEMAPKLRELADHRRTIDWARRRLDPEGRGTHFSVLDVYETGELIKKIEKKRGRIVASRMLYGSEMEESCAVETIGVLKAAIKEAIAEQAKWRRYLEDSRAKK